MNLRSIAHSCIAKPGGLVRAAGVSTLLLCLGPSCSATKRTDDGGSSKASAKPVKALKLKAEGKADCRNPVVDDVEDGNLDILSADQRGGFWYTYKDSLGTTLTPEGSYAQASSGAQGSKGAARISGKLGAQGIVYAGLGLHFNRTQAPYDLSPTSGLCFRAKGTGWARVAVPDVNTIPEGGICKNCYNTFGKDFELAAAWQEYCFKFTQLAQSPYWGDQVEAVAVKTAFGIQWRVAEAGTDYDLWVDDVRLACD